MNIAVYCGSSFGNDPSFRTEAERVGRMIGEEGHTLVYGGSEVGLMGVVANAVLKAGGRVIGVEPQFFIDEGLVHKGITETIVVETMSERKARMMELSDAFIALPGGAGTLDEFSEVLVLAGLGRMAKPCILYDMKRFYEPLKAAYRSMAEAGFLGTNYLEKLLSVTNVEELKGALMSA